MLLVKPPVWSAGKFGLVYNGSTLEQKLVFGASCQAPPWQQGCLVAQWALYYRTLVLVHCVLDPEEGSFFLFWFIRLLPREGSLRQFLFVNRFLGSFIFCSPISLFLSCISGMPLILLNGLHVSLKYFFLPHDI